MKPLYAAALAALSVTIFSCASTSKTAPNNQDFPTASGPGSKTLSEAYRDHFPIGAAVAAGEYGFDSFKRYPPELMAQFGSLTAENAMKPAVIQPRRGSFSWDAADAIADYARANGKRVRGHTLVWHNQSPQWMFRTSSSQEERREWARAVLREHMTAVMTRYKGTVYCWDVVNEAIADGTGKSIYRTDSPWYRMWGDATYVREAFAIARSIDPDALLFYNDYGMDNSAKRERVIEMIDEQGLVADGLIDGIGLQGHWTIEWPSSEEIQNAIDELSATGLTLHITELDITCPADKRGMLADRYDEIFTRLRKNARKVTSVTFWGVADDHTWLNDFRGFKNYPFVFDERHQPKKAFYRVRDF